MSAFTHNLQGRDRKLARLQAERRIYRGLQKVTAFKKVNRSIVKILVCGSFVWYIWLWAKNCLKWGKIYIASEMLFAAEGGGGGRRVGIQDVYEQMLFFLAFQVSLFFPGIPLFRSCFFTHKLWKSEMFSLHFRTISINLDFYWRKLFIISKGKNRQSQEKENFFNKNEILWLNEQQIFPSSKSTVKGSL